MEPQSLKDKAAHGVFWSSVDRFANQGISFCFSIFLARLLAPEDYGVIAMIAFFLAIAQVFIDSGFGGALIRKPKVTKEDLSTAFYFNIFIGFFLYTILFLLSPYIASFYDIPILAPIIKIIGLTLIVNSLCIVQTSILAKAIDFKRQAKISLFCTVLSGGFGLFLAYRGMGVWALVSQTLSSKIVYCILLWGTAKWRPELLFCKTSFLYLWGYGSKMLASGLLATIYENVYPIVIGKFYSPGQLGLYSRAQSYAALFSSNVTGVLQSSTFPVLSLIQTDEKRLAIDYRRLLKMSAFLVFPMMMGLAAIAHPLIIVMITDRWIGCVAYLQIICFAMMWYPIHAINLNLLQVKGRSDLFLKLEIIKKIVGVVVLCVTIPIGVLAMCYGQLFSSLFSLLINTFYTGRLIHVGFIKQIKDLLFILLNSLIMGGVLYLTTLVLESNIGTLLLQIILAILLYSFLSYFFAKSELLELVGLLKNKIKAVNI